jgi:hypothetical protein
VKSISKDKAQYKNSNYYLNRNQLRNNEGQKVEQIKLSQLQSEREIDGQSHTYFIRAFPNAVG